VNSFSFIEYLFPWFPVSVGSIKFCQQRKAEITREVICKTTNSYFNEYLNFCQTTNFDTIENKGNHSILCL